MDLEKAERPIKVLMAKPGVDGHEWGVFTIIDALKNAGIEVIYTGLWQTPAMIVNSSIEEDVDLIALSSLGGSHMTTFAKIMELLKEKNAEQIPVVAGGIIPDEDIEDIKKMGVSGLYGPGTELSVIVAHIKERALENR